MAKVGYRFECILLEPCIFICIQKNGGEYCITCIDSLKKCIMALHVPGSVLVVAWVSRVLLGEKNNEIKLMI